MENDSGASEEQDPRAYNPLKVKLSKADRVFQMPPAGQDPLQELNALAAEVSQQSLEKFTSGSSYYSNPKAQMGTWLDAAGLARVFAVLNSTIFNTKAAEELYSLSSTMKVLQFDLAFASSSSSFPSSPPQYTLKLFHVPAYATLPTRSFAEGTVLVYKRLYGRGQLSALAPGGKQIQSDEITLFSRVGGLRRIASWREPGEMLSPETKIASPLGFLELAFAPPIPGENELGEVASVSPAFAAWQLSTLFAPPPPPPPLPTPPSSTSSTEQQQQQLPPQVVLRQLKARIGGLDEVLEEIVRRVLKSRSLPPKILSSLGISHTRGLLLWGMPGTGKTLIARELAAALGKKTRVRIVNGPELMEKYVGESERRVRELFAEADEEWDRKGHKSDLHVIIFYEFDAVGRRRSAATMSSSEGNGVRESVVNQLLAKLDGVTERNNVLVIGLTNRRDLIDPALLRPGRLEVQIEVPFPTRAGRLEILNILLEKLKTGGFLTEDEVKELATFVAERTQQYTGADLAGVVRSAASFAIARAEGLDEILDEEQAVAKIKLTRQDFQDAVRELSQFRRKISFVDRLAEGVREHRKK
jgi:ATP-dependent 26S proteasome regulatory subunit